MFTNVVDQMLSVTLEQAKWNQAGTITEIKGIGLQYNWKSCFSDYAGAANSRA